MYIENIGERGFIQRIRSKFPLKDRTIILGIGDDAAIIRPSPGKSILISTDTLREDIHFEKRYFTYYDIGWKAVAVSLSDIAAMGGLPRYLMLSIAVPYKTHVKDLDILLNGVADISDRYNVSLIGGNVSRSKDGVTVDTTVIGGIQGENGLVRSGAIVGDLIYVTGTIGGSAIGLALLSSSGIAARSTISGTSLLLYHLRPIPRVREGIIIEKNKLATAMIDISDGLLADLSRICEESNVGAHIYSPLIPSPDVPDRLKKRLEKDPLFYALYGGEDYELLFTVKRKDKGRLERVCKRAGFNVTFIGEIVSQENGIRIVGRDGIERVMEPLGYDHFRKIRGRIC